jgi:hypothetical protein
MSQQIKPTSLFLIVGLMLLAAAKWAYDKGTSGV